MIELISVVSSALTLASALMSLFLVMKYMRQARLQADAIRALDARLRAIEVVAYDIGYTPVNGVWIKRDSHDPFSAEDPGVNNVG